MHSLDGGEHMKNKSSKFGAPVLKALSNGASQAFLGQVEREAFKKNNKKVLGNYLSTSRKGIYFWTS